MCLRVSYEKHVIFLHPKSHWRKESESGARSVSQRYGSADPDPHQNVTDPQHWLLHFKSFLLRSTHAQLFVQLLRTRHFRITSQHTRFRWRVLRHLNEMHLRMREVGHHLNGVVLCQEFQLCRIHFWAQLDLECHKRIQKCAMTFTVYTACIYLNIEKQLYINI